MGHLLLTGGAEALARRIAREHLLARLPELHSPALARWATGNGFTLEELALIQPSYHSPPPEQRVCLTRVPTVLRYEQGWAAVPCPLDSGELRDGWELPWLAVSQEGSADAQLDAMAASTPGEASPSNRGWEIAPG